MVFRKIAWGSFFAMVMLGLTWGGLILAQNNTPPPPYQSYNSGAFFFPPYPSERDRMGFGQAIKAEDYKLRGRWYLNWGANSSPTYPAGAEYVPHLKFTVNAGGGQPCRNPATELSHITPSLTGTALIQAVQKHPGALWVVGNEPDSIYNGSPIQAELYAELYHHFYTQIKTADPLAKVAIAAIVQPSPVRLEYLDKILTHYQATYHQPLPTDLWNIHFYILNEGPCGTWGATRPPFSSNMGWQYDDVQASELLDLAMLETNLRAFRQWMRDRGYRNIPLIITEFGVLIPEDFEGFERDKSAQFLTNIFDMLRTATDPDTGYPADGNRLVQMWAWFSTHTTQFGGDLFVEATTTPLTELTPIGEAFVQQTYAYDTPYLDLQIEPTTSGLILDGGTLNNNQVTVGAYVSNRGTLTATNVQAQISFVDFFDQTPLQTTIIDLPDAAPRYQGPPSYLEDTFMVTPPFALTITAVTNPNALIQDANLQNDTLTQFFGFYPDLMINNLTVQPVTLPEGQPDVATFITTTLSNTGNWTSTSIPLKVEISNSNDLIVLAQTETLPPLAPQQAITIVTPWTISEAERYKIALTANPDNQPAFDLDAANHAAQVEILIPAHYQHLPLLLSQLGGLLE